MYTEVVFLFTAVITVWDRLISYTLYIADCTLAIFFYRRGSIDLHDPSLYVRHYLISANNWISLYRNCVWKTVFLKTRHFGCSFDLNLLKRVCETLEPNSVALLHDEYNRRCSYSAVMEIYDRIVYCPLKLSFEICINGSFVLPKSTRSASRKS